MCPASLATTIRSPGRKSPADASSTVTPSAANRRIAPSPRTSRASPSGTLMASRSVPRGHSRLPGAGRCARQSRATDSRGAAMPLKYGSTGASPSGGVVVFVHSHNRPGRTSGARPGSSSGGPNTDATDRGERSTVPPSPPVCDESNRLNTVAGSGPYTGHVSASVLERLPSRDLTGGTWTYVARAWGKRPSRFSRPNLWVSARTPHPSVTRYSASMSAPTSRVWVATTIR